MAIGVEPTNETDATPGCVSSASTASRSPWTTLNAPSGRPASASHSAISSDADGSFSLGLRMNALPHASASGNIHIGTIAGKLNGVMPTDTPSGWRSECESTPVADLLGRLALEQVRGAARELDDLEAALDLAARVVDASCRARR